MTLPLSRKQIMVSAWRIARFDARKLGGTARSHFAAALRLAWKSWRNLRDNLSPAGRAVLREVELIRAEAVAPRQPRWTGYVPSFARRAA